MLNEKMRNQIPEKDVTQVAHPSFLCILDDKLIYGSPKLFNSNLDLSVAILSISFIYQNISLVRVSHHRLG